MDESSGDAACCSRRRSGPRNILPGRGLRCLDSTKLRFQGKTALLHGLSWTCEGLEDLVFIYGRPFRGGRVCGSRGEVSRMAAVGTEDRRHVLNLMLEDLEDRSGIWSRCPRVALRQRLDRWEQKRANGPSSNPAGTLLAQSSIHYKGIDPPLTWLQGQNPMPPEVIGR